MDSMHTTASANTVPPLSLAVLQTNPTVGDLQGNAQALVAAACAAYAQGARFVVTGAMALCGAPLGDLAQRPAFAQACSRAVDDMARQLANMPDLTVVTSHAGGLVVLRGGEQIALHAATQHVCMLHVQGVRIAVVDAHAQGGASAAQAGTTAHAQLLCMLAALPWHMEQPARREQAVMQLARQTNMPILTAHIVGGQDGCVFDGASFAVQADGTVAGRAAGFAPDNWLVHASPGAAGMVLQASTVPWPANDATVGLPPCQQPYSSSAVWQALVLGTRDYVRKSGFQNVLLGLSGGMDSALVLALAVDALGAEHVRTVMMPSPYTAQISLDDAREMALRMGVQHDVMPIAPVFAAFEQALAPLFAGRSADLTEENLQARIRGTLLMALSNKFGALVLVTGNKSEFATGYSTLYGDTAGAFAPIKDVLKTQVFALARWRNAHDPFGTGLHPIPERIITRPPSAELRPDQTDQDSLPPYEVLDAIVMQYMERDLPAADIMANGLPADAVQQVMRLMRISEYKRQQAPIGVRISRRAFGDGWRYPLVNQFRE